MSTDFEEDKQKALKKQAAGSFKKAGTAIADLFGMGDIVKAVTDGCADMAEVKKTAKEGPKAYRDAKDKLKYEEMARRQYEQPPPEM